MQVLLPIGVFLWFCAQINGQTPMCLDYGNFTSGDTYETNLNSLLDSIATTNSSSLTYGWFDASVGPGQDSDGTYTVGYCNGDLELDDCRVCLEESARQIRQVCPVQKDALFFLDNCTIGYSNNSWHSGTYYAYPYVMLLDTRNASYWDTFKQELNQLLDDLRGQAASGDTLRKYAEGSGPVYYDSIYATVQCMPLLSEKDCSDCLLTATQLLPYCCDGKAGGQVMVPSCRLRYSTDRFFDPVAVPLQSPPPQTPAMTPSSQDQSQTSSSSKVKWFGISASCAAAVLVVGVIVFLIMRRKNRPKQGLITQDVDDLGGNESLQFDFDIVRAATDNFSDVNKLGQGGFGSVYMGKLPNGEEIAVKRLSMGSKQGEAEFKNEVGLLMKLQHRNLVRLLGYCLQGDEKLLVYEYLPNSSLDRFIFDPIKCARLNWDDRYKIITGIARGLLYLHEDSRLRIIHRDLKAGNVLLDADLNPKVSDFGMARLFELDQTQADKSRIVGTHGYMAPEYLEFGHFSIRSDVFSFGVLVLEIVSGWRNLVPQTEEESTTLTTQAWRKLMEGALASIIDPALSSVSTADIRKCIHIALLCVQEEVTSRPTMASVVLMLNSNSVTLPVPTQPAFFRDATTRSPGALVYETNPDTVSEASITAVYPR